MQVHSLQNFGLDWDLQVAGKICRHLQSMKKQQQAKICSCKGGKIDFCPDCSVLLQTLHLHEVQDGHCLEKFT